MDTPHYVHNDVLADVLLSQMFHFTHHSDIAAALYVNTAVLSDVLLAWMNHYTHHSGMDPTH
jgi:hypothetical protein